MYILRLMDRCNNRCKFCMVKEERKDAKEISLEKIKKIISQQEPGSEFNFFGGEPTLYPYFFQALKLAKQRGLKCTVSTNGRAFSSDEFTKKAAGLGIDYIMVSLYGHKSELHEKHTEVPGSFKETVGGIKNIIRYNIPILTHTVITKYNYVHLKDILMFLWSLKIPSVRFSLLINAKNDPEILPRLNEIRPYLIEAFQYAEKKGLQLEIEKAPTCLAPTYVEKFISEKDATMVLDDFFTLSKQCDKCKYKLVSCFGVDKDYGEIYGLQELTPIYPDDYSTSLNQFKLKLGPSCNNNCIFCVEDEANKIPFRTTEDIKDEIKKIPSDAKLTLTGGEVTVRWDIKDIFYSAMSRGIYVEIQTNGRAFADYKITRELVENGLCEATVTLLGHNETVHDSITRAKGSFNETIAGIRNLIDNGVVVNSIVVVTIKNVKYLEDIALFLAKNFPQLGYVQFNMPCIEGATKTNFYDVVPQVSKAYKHVIAAVDVLRKTNIYPMIDSLPLCYLDGYETYATDIITYLPSRFLQSEKRPTKEALESLYGFTCNMRKAKVKGEQCKLCNLEPLCDGLWKGYVEKYTANELIPVFSKDIKDILSEMNWGNTLTNTEESALKTLLVKD